MAVLREYLRRLWGTFRGRRADRHWEEELRLHLELAAEDARRRGDSPEGAIRAARLRAGTIPHAMEAIRDQRGLPWLEDFGRDLRYALNALKRNPGFAAIAVLTLALGIGANTAIFSVLYDALLQPLPYAEPDRIFSVETVIPDRQDQVPSLPMRIQDFLEWRRADTAFSAIAALTPSEWNLTGGGEAQRIGGARVSVNFFSFLGVPIASGRGFLPEEEQPGRDRVVVISDAIWRSRYGGTSAVLNSTIFLNGDSHLVVGIAPPSLLVPTGTMLHTSLPFAPRIDVWKPIAPTERDLEGENWNYGLLVRLKSGDSAERGRLQLQAMLNRSLRAVVPDLTTEFQTRLTPMREIYAGKIRLRLLLVSAAAGLLLLAACTNVANLYLGRVASRSQEFAIRVALGARGSRLLAQIFTESTCLALIGGGLGVALAYLSTGVLLSQGPESGTQVIFFSTDTDSPGLALQRPVAGFRNVTPGYFAASGTPLRAGRIFTEQDVTPVAVIGESLGRRLWPGVSPAGMVGRSIRQGAVNAPDITVVGVVQDVRPGAVDRELPPQLYRPHHQAPSGRMSVLVRTSQDPSASSASVRDLVRRADPTVPISAMRTMQEIVSESLLQRRFQMVLTSLFGMVSLLLGAVGVYGVVSYAVACRTREIGLRLALGATRREVVVWVFSGGMRPALIGLGAGVLGALALARGMRHLLFGIGPLDPAAFGSVVIVLLMTAALACYLPARRAARMDPLTALRQD